MANRRRRFSLRKLVRLFFCCCKRKDHRDDETDIAVALEGGVQVSEMDGSALERFLDEVILGTEQLSLFDEGTSAIFASPIWSPKETSEVTEMQIFHNVHGGELELISLDSIQMPAQEVDEMKEEVRTLKDILKSAIQHPLPEGDDSDGEEDIVDAVAALFENCEEEQRREHPS